MSLQITIRKSVAVDGIGLHTGQPSRISLAPAPPDTGIVFHTLSPHRTPIPARPEFVVDSHFATTLGVNGNRVQTVEHLMAAAGAMGIDNLFVEVEGGEIPALDGSAKPFVSLLYAAGKLTQPAPRQPIVIAEPIRIGAESRWLQILPGDGLRISYTLDLDHPAVGTQTASFACSEQVFVDELASARTYGFLKDVGALRKNGLAKGGSLDNAVVVGRRVILNESLRFHDEFVRHKILDLIGDLALLGRPLVGHVVARNAGHFLNHQLICAIQEAVRLAERPLARGLTHSVNRPREAPGRDGLEPLPGVAAL